MGDVTDPAFRREERIGAATLRVTRKSTFSGAVHTLDLPITAEQWHRHTAREMLIQDALPDLSNAQREFLLTGTTQAEWDHALADDEDDEDEGEEGLS